MCLISGDRQRSTQTSCSPVRRTAINCDVTVTGGARHRPMWHAGCKCQSEDSRERTDTMMKSDISLRFTDKRQGIIRDHPCAHMHLTDFSFLECSLSSRVFFYFNHFLHSYQGCFNSPISTDLGGCEEWSEVRCCDPSHASVCERVFRKETRQKPWGALRAAECTELYSHLGC